MAQENQQKVSAEELKQKIIECKNQLKENPANPELYLQRAKLKLDILNRSKNTPEAFKKSIDRDIAAYVKYSELEKIADTFIEPTISAELKKRLAEGILETLFTNHEFLLTCLNSSFFYTVIMKEIYSMTEKNKNSPLHFLVVSLKKTVLFLTHIQDQRCTQFLILQINTFTDTKLFLEGFIKVILNCKLQPRFMKLVQAGINNIVDNTAEQEECTKEQKEALLALKEKLIAHFESLPDENSLKSLQYLAREAIIRNNLFDPKKKSETSLSRDIIKFITSPCVEESAFSLFNYSQRIHKLSGLALSLLEKKQCFVELIQFCKWLNIFDDALAHCHNPVSDIYEHAINYAHKDQDIELLLFIFEAALNVPELAKTTIETATQLFQANYFMLGFGHISLHPEEYIQVITQVAIPFYIKTNQVLLFKLLHDALIKKFIIKRDQEINQDTSEEKNELSSAVENYLNPFYCAVKFGANKIFFDTLFYAYDASQLDGFINSKKLTVVRRGVETDNWNVLEIAISNKRYNEFFFLVENIKLHSALKQRLSSYLINIEPKEEGTKVITILHVFMEYCTDNDDAALTLPTLKYIIDLLRPFGDYVNTVSYSRGNTPLEILFDENFNDVYQSHPTLILNVIDILVKNGADPMFKGEMEKNIFNIIDELNNMSNEHKEIVRAHLQPQSSQHSNVILPQNSNDNTPTHSSGFGM
jgi:hypothetical protein